MPRSSPPALGQVAASPRCVRARHQLACGAGSKQVDENRHWGKKNSPHPARNKGQSDLLRSLSILKAMSSCMMKSMNWNQGLISLLGRGMCTANTMSLASICLLTASSKSLSFSQWLGPQGISHLVLWWFFLTSMHFTDM